MSDNSRESELASDVSAAQQGDDQAFARVYRELTPRLLRYAAGLVGASAEDVVAEAWLQITRDLSKFAGGFDAFRGWTTRIVRNRAIDLLRHNQRRPAVAADLSALFDQSGPLDTEASALDSISTTEAIELIATLPREQAEAVLLRAVVGLDPAAAAEILGKRAGAVRVASHRGLRNLAKTLAARADRPNEP